MLDEYLPGKPKLEFSVYYVEKQNTNLYTRYDYNFLGKMPK